MSKTHNQRGYIFERNGSIHIRYNVHLKNGARQRSHKLCDVNESTPSTDAPSVVKLAEVFMQRINEANQQDGTQGHNCPLCGNRCAKTIHGRFARTAGVSNA